MQRDLTSAAHAAAAALAEAFGLGERILEMDDWPVEQGDTVFVARLGGPVTAELCIALNDEVGEQLAASSDVLHDGVRRAVGALELAMGLTVPLELLALERSQVAPPTVVAGISGEEQLTALVGLTVEVPSAMGDPLASAPLDSPAATPAYADHAAAQAAPATPTAPASQHFQPEQFGDVAKEPAPHRRPLSVLHDVDLVVTAELGRTTMPVRELLERAPGMVVEIDRAAGAPIDLLVNGRRIASGEVVVIDEEFGVRITEILEGEPA
jgi:flagellar motor switch protein FliN/FliY